MFNGFEAWVRAELARDHSPSVSVAVGRGGEVVHASAFGLADVSQGRAATPETAYLLASVTKPMTATCVCLLAARGALDLDAPIERYLGGIGLPSHGSAAPPTVRQVLRHRGGLGRFYRVFYADEHAVVPSFAETIDRYGHVFRPPGERYEYSNLGYGLLDEAIRVAVDRETGDLMRDELFAPLGMPSASFGPTYGGDGQPPTRYAIGGEPYPDYDTEARGASLAWASAPDLVRFGLAHLSAGSALPPEVTCPMVEAPPDPISDRLGFGYGLGWTIKHLDDLTVVSHAGLMGGVAGLLALVPRERLAIAVLANATSSRLPWIVTTRLIAEALGPSAPDLRGVWDEGPDRPEPLTAEVVADLVGTWRGIVATPSGDVPLELRVLSDGVALVSVDGGSTVGATVASDPQGGIEVTVPVPLPTPDARDRTDAIACSLDLVPDALTGTANAERWPWHPPDRDHRYGSSLPHRCELLRAASR